jgi:hypothetical protein
MPAALIFIEGAIVDSTALKIVFLDSRNLRFVANISGIMDDNKLLAFIIFKDRVAGGERLGNYERRGDNNKVIATIRSISIVYYRRRR